MDMYKFNLTTYEMPPLETSSLFELEKICEERLNLYKIMDEALNLDLKPNSNKWEKYVEHLIVQRKLTTYITFLKSEQCVVNQDKARRNNNIAHWTLSLCYCHTRFLRNFFVGCELNWFVMLYKRTKKEDLPDFFRQNIIKYENVYGTEYKLIKDKLFHCGSMKASNFTSTYKVKFNEITNLVRRRKVFLYKGYAYLGESELIFHMKEKLWMQFNRQLLWNKKMFPSRINENRLEHFLKHLPIFTPSYRRCSDKEVIINLQNIDEIALIHFPLCMKTIHTVLRREHHLKYDCKMQYGIFLKWVGLSYQHAMEFWKNEFIQKMSAQWFDRKYSYLFKYQYGKVGGMVQYSPYTCEKILSIHPGPGQHHGCPFKHWDLERLLEKCKHDGFIAQDINDLKQLIIGNKYKEACSLYFNITHKVNMRDVFKSPNQYFEASYEFENSLNMCLNNIFQNCASEDFTVSE